MTRPTAPSPNGLTVLPSALPDEFIGQAEIARRLHCDERTVRLRLKQGVIPHERAGKRYLVHRAAFERWLAEGRKPDAPSVTTAPVPWWARGDQPLEIEGTFGGVPFALTIRPQQATDEPAVLRWPKR